MKYLSQPWRMAKISKSIFESKLFSNITPCSKKEKKEVVFRYENFKISTGSEIFYIILKKDLSKTNVFNIT